VPHGPVTDLNARETVILVAIVAGIFAIGLFPGEPLGKTELAAREFQQQVLGAPAQLGSVR
jgi:NADH:ubiquinone oxidoreductase subunit 4 (subunit M)